MEQGCSRSKYKLGEKAEMIFYSEEEVCGSVLRKIRMGLEKKNK